MHLLSVLTLVFTATSTVLGQAHAPQPGGSVAQLQHRHSFMAKYPEFFERHKRQEPSMIFPPYCKRGLQERSFHKMLDPVDVAAMLVGRGTYTHSNGTRAVDSHYIDVMEAGLRAAEKRGFFSKIVRDKLGNALLEFTLPYYKTWRDQFATKPDFEIALSNLSGFRARDLAAVERALLAHPDFDEIQVGGYRVTRRFIEAAVDLEESGVNL